MADQSWRELETSKTMWKDHALFFRLLRGLVLIVVLGLIGIAIYTTDTARESFSVNVFTAVISAVATALIFDELNRKRSQDEYKRQLIDDAASTSNEKAKDAVHQLSRKGWLTGDDGLLKDADLNRASLSDADLQNANLKEARLIAAKLERANLWGVELQGADLFAANLDDARLDWAKLQEANLYMADMLGTNLQGANLQDADLQDAALINPIFNVLTILPNGEYWEEGTDMNQFIDKHSANFWRSDNPDSPAYRGSYSEI